MAMDGLSVDLFSISSESTKNQKYQVNNNIFIIQQVNIMKRKLWTFYAEL
jgi:hypothetical protein